jgi:hypothetical protein
MPYSLQSAATACGVNRSTILRAVKSGRISATKDELGAWVLEPVEVHRVYPLVAVDGASPVAVPNPARGDSATDILVEELRGMIARMAKEHERAIGDLQRDRDEWRDQAKRLALGAPQAAQPTHQPAPPPPTMAISPTNASTGMAPVHSAPRVERRGWLERLLRKTG